MINFLCACECVTNGIATEDTALSIWVPAIVSIVTLVITIIFTVYVSPRIAEKQNQRAAMYKICTDFFDYLTDLVSLDDFSGAPSTVRKYSMKIHFMYKSGSAPEDIKEGLEKIYQKVKVRKTMEDAKAIEKWEKEFRDEVRVLRKELSRYVGVFKSRED